MTATLTIFNGGEAFIVTGKVHRVYSSGVSIDTADGLRFFAMNERVTLHETKGEWLW